MVYFTLFDLPRKRKGRGSDDTSRPENVTYDYGFPVPISAGIIEQVSRKADGSSNLTVSRDGSLFQWGPCGFCEGEEIFKFPVKSILSRIVPCSVLVYLPCWANFYLN